MTNVKISKTWLEKLLSGRPIEYAGGATDGNAFTLQLDDMTWNEFLTAVSDGYIKNYEYRKHTNKTTNTY